MEIVVLVAIVLIGLILLLSHTLRNRNMTDVLLLSILLVLSGFSFTVFAEEGLIFYFGVFLSVIGFLTGTVRFFVKEKAEMENS